MGTNDEEIPRGSLFYRRGRLNRSTSPVLGKSVGTEERNRSVRCGTVELDISFTLVKRDGRRIKFD